MLGGLVGANLFNVEIDMPEKTEWDFKLRLIKHGRCSEHPDVILKKRSKIFFRC